MWGLETMAKETAGLGSGLSIESCVCKLTCASVKVFMIMKL